jgi:hypothetical protein
VGVDRVAQRLLPVDIVAIVPAFTDARQRAGLLPIAEDPLDRAANDADAFGQVTEPDPRLSGDANQDLGMVAEGSPAGRSCHHFDVSPPPGLDGSTRIR